MALQLVSNSSDGSFAQSYNSCASAESQQTASAVMTTNTNTDQQLVERVQRGDRRAFDLLVMKYQSKVLALINRYVKDSHEAMDVAQETFIKAYRAMGSFRGDSAFYTWLFRIAVNCAKNALAAQGRKPPGSDVELEDAVYWEGSGGLKDANSPEKHLQKDQLQAVLFKAIQGLPEDLRAALSLREFDGLSYEEIAEIMQCPVGTVRSRIFRAREAVEGSIAPLLDHTAATA